MNFPEPKTLKQLHSFIGLTSYFRKYIQDYAAIASPLTDLLRKNQVYLFTDVGRSAFNTLKQRLCEQPVLMIYHPGLPTELHTDDPGMHTQLFLCNEVRMMVIYILSIIQVVKPLTVKENIQVMNWKPWRSSRV